MYLKNVPAKIYRDEIFDYQDQLDKCRTFDEIYNLCDEILWELEGRLTVEPELLSELEKIHEEVENGDYHRFEEYECDLNENE